MLKELFVLRSGTPLFYYSEKELNEQEIDQSLLSSGLLSAISSFSEEARSSELQSFSSDEEIFVFQKLPEFDAILAGAFDRESNVKMGNIILNIIKSELLKRDILGQEDTIDLLAKDKVQFAKEVPQIIAKFVLKDNREEYFENVVDKIPGLFLAFVEDIENGELIYKFARPRPLFKEEYPKDLGLIYQVSNNMITKLQLGQRLSAITVEGKGKRYASYNNQLYVNLMASNLADRSELENAVRSVGYSQRDSVQLGEEAMITGSYRLVNRSIEHIAGNEFLKSNANIFLMTVINNIDKLFEKLFNSQPENIFLHIQDKGTKIYKIRLERQNDDEIMVIKIS